MSRLITWYVDEAVTHPHHLVPLNGRHSSPPAGADAGGGLADFLDRVDHRPAQRHVGVEVVASAAGGEQDHIAGRLQHVLAADAVVERAL